MHSDSRVPRLRAPKLLAALALAGAACSLVALAGCQLAAKGQNAEGVRLFEQAYYQGALTRFQQAVQTDPQNADGYYNLARTYQQLGKANQNKAELDQAESLYNQCLDRNHDHQDCHRGLAVLLRDQGRTPEAFRLLEGWSERSPTLAGPKIELARLHEEAGNRDAAKQQLVEAVAADPNNAKALAALGKLREETGNAVQALSDYQRSLAINRFQPQVAARVAALQTALAPAPQGMTPTSLTPPTAPGWPTTPSASGMATVPVTPLR